MGAKLLDVGFRLDAGASLGGGHLIRCGALSSAMTRRGWRTTLYGTPETVALAAGAPEFAAVKPLQPQSAGDPSALDPAHDMIVVDHYGLDAAYERAARQRVGALGVFSDFPDRGHDCDILIDQNVGREAADYAGLTEPGCAVLAGSDYVLLRPAFGGSDRPNPKAITDNGRNLLVTLGASDPENATADILSMLRSTAWPNWRIRAVLGPSYAHKAEISRLADSWAALEIVDAPTDLHASIRWADAAVTAAGGTCWELCYMAVPFAVVTLGKMRNTNARILQERGAALDLGDMASVRAGSLRRALGDLMADTKRRRSLAASAGALIDGRGAERICDRIGERLCAE